MKLVLFCLASFFCVVSFSQSFNHAITGGAGQKDRVMDLKVSPNQDVISTGSFRQTVDFDPSNSQVNRSSNGSDDIFVCSYSAANVLNWVYTVGGGQEDFGRALSIDANGNIYVGGWFEDSLDFDPSPTSSFILHSNGSSDAFLLKLDANGNFIWAKSFGGSGEDVILDMEFHPNGTVVTCGRFANSVDFDPNGNNTSMVNSNKPRNSFISAFDVNGNLSWYKTYLTQTNSQGAYRASALAVSKNGNILVGGAFGGTVTFDNSGTFPFNLTASAGMDCYLASYDQFGNFNQAVKWGGTSESVVSGAATDENNNIYLSGYFYSNAYFDPGNTNNRQGSNGSRDIYVSSLDANLNFRWVRTGGALSAEAALDICTDANSNVYATGYFYSSFDATPAAPNPTMINNQGAGDFFILSYDSSGTFNQATFNGGTSDDISIAIDTRGPNEVLIGGNFRNTVNFNPTGGNATVSSNGAQDFFIQSVNFCFESRDSVDAFGCQFFVSPSGKLYNASGLYKDTIPNAAGCDSIITINLSLNQLGTSISRTDSSLFVAAVQNVSYQWLDCNNNYSPIQGATSAIFVPTQNGSYAVEVSQGTCMDTSTCQQILSVGLNEDYNTQKISVYPNPNQGQFFLDGIQKYPQARVSVYRSNGQLLSSQQASQNQSFEIDGSDSIYFLIIDLGNGQTIRKKIIKNL
ncbi:MAG: T9SS type A sorting domain-containing protein [Vicingaceae bacterium]